MDFYRMVSKSTPPGFIFFFPIRVIFPATGFLAGSFLI